jgi:hypothetical protein
MASVCVYSQFAINAHLLGGGEHKIHAGALALAHLCAAPIKLMLFEWMRGGCSFFSLCYGAACHSVRAKKGGG